MFNETRPKRYQIDPHFIAEPKFMCHLTLAKSFLLQPLAEASKVLPTVHLRHCVNVFGFSAAQSRTFAQV
jgi:hypothetical protein